MILETVNAGALGRTGEIRILRELLRACDSSHPTYREFCLSILLRGRIHGLSYEDGLSLFDTALDALPLQDKTLKHHRGRWIRRHGNPIVAEQALEEALHTADYPHAMKAEADEHIFT